MSLELLELTTGGKERNFGVGAGVGCGVGRGVGLGVGRGVGLGVGCGVGGIKQPLLNISRSLHSFMPQLGQELVDCVEMMGFQKKNLKKLFQTSYETISLSGNKIKMATDKHNIK